MDSLLEPKLHRMRMELLGSLRQMVERQQQREREMERSGDMPSEVYERKFQAAEVFYERIFDTAGRQAEQRLGIKLPLNPIAEEYERDVIPPDEEPGFYSIVAHFHFDVSETEDDEEPTTNSPHELYFGLVLYRYVDGKHELNNLYVRALPVPLDGNTLGDEDKKNLTEAVSEQLEILSGHIASVESRVRRGEGQQLMEL